MKINISNDTAMTIIAALREHVKTNGVQVFGPKGDPDNPTNKRVLQIFEALLAHELQNEP